MTSRERELALDLFVDAYWALVEGAQEMNEKRAAEASPPAA